MPAITVNFQFAVEVKLNKPIGNLHPECIQSAIKKLITDNPDAFMGSSPEDILQNVWVSLKNKYLEKKPLTTQPNSPLSITTEKQRQEMSLALQELGDEDLEWTLDIILARKNKQYPHHFFDE
jgi:hypothetical protein